MSIEISESPGNVVPFGRRKARPHVCVIAAHPHSRAVLKEALDDAGLIAGECATTDELAALLERQPPALVIMRVAPDGIESARVLNKLSAANFAGKILLLGSRNLPALAAVRQAGEEAGLAILPPLFTPFSDAGLRAGVAALLPAEDPPRPPADVAEAVTAGWLQLWYQPKVNAQSLSFDGAEALLRMHHPKWGLVPPAYFIPADGDPRFAELSDFVIGRAVEDWRRFLPDHGHVGIAINLPTDYLRNPRRVESLCARLPRHPAFRGMIVEVNGTELLRNLEVMKQVAAQVRAHKIGIAIDDLGAEWPSLLTKVGYFPFVEIKVDRKLVFGCANDRLKRGICRQILDFANSVGSRSVAEGIENRDDLRCVRDMGFDIAQGFLFAKPMMARTMQQYLPSRSPAPRHRHIRREATLAGPEPECRI